MRPQQQNRRMRGRGNNNNNNNNNNNRKGPNPLTRSYESNGPDVKIRGTAQQIAEKYSTLARDAHSSGDRVMAENYLQHAEHYNRLIAAALAQVQPQQNVRESRDETEEDLDEREEQENFFPSFPRPATADGSGPQPVIEGLPAEVALKERELAANGNGRANGSGRPNGRGHDGGNGGNPRHAPNGTVNAEVQGERPAAPEAAEPVAAEAPAEATAADEASAPRRRTRRRTKKSEDGAPDEVASAEPADS